MPFSVNVFLYDEDKWKDRQYLVFYRNERADLQLPSFWQGVTGGVEKDETLEDTVRREVKEETGISLNKIDITDFSYQYPIKDVWRHSYPKDATHITEYVFYAKVSANPTLSDEHKEIKWVTFDEGLKLMTFGMNKESLEIVEKCLNRSDAVN
ncbi:MAG: NUDIX domain-containing protein [Halopseudomonas aestusnigri]